MSVYTFLRSAGWKLKGYPAARTMAFLQQSQDWQRAQLLSYRDERVRSLVLHCYENVPYYRRVMEASRLRPHDITRAEDLTKLPLLTKGDLRRHQTALLARNISSDSVAWSRTGGTTGEPIRVAKDKHCAAWESMSYERGLHWGGLSVDQPRIRLFGGSLGLDRMRWTTRIGKIFRRDLLLPAFELRSDTAPVFFEAIRRSGLRHVVGYASALYRLAKLADVMARDVCFDAVFPTAEQLLPEWHDQIRKSFACKILPYYGCGEMNSLGFVKDANPSYVIPEEHCLIEAVREDGAAGFAGDGRFALTSLANYAMPLLRYVNGDAGSLGLSRDGSPFACIDRLDGRYNSFLMTDSGELISGVIGTHVFRQVVKSVESYRIIQEEPLRIVIKIVPRENSVPETDVQLIQRLFAKHLGDKMRVDTEIVQSLPPLESGKTVFVINKCLETR
jgi:phenylacetate-CoA ligase